MATSSMMKTQMRTCLLVLPRDSRKVCLNSSSAAPSSRVHVEFQSFSLNNPRVQCKPLAQRVVLQLRKCFGGHCHKCEDCRPFGSLVYIWAFSHPFPMQLDIKNFPFCLFYLFIISLTVTGAKVEIIVTYCFFRHLVTTAVHIII